MAAVAITASLTANAAPAPAASNGNKPSATQQAENKPRSFAKELHKAVDGDHRARAEDRRANADAAQDADTKARGADRKDAAEGADKDTDDDAANAAAGMADPASLLPPGWSPLTSDRAAAKGDAIDAEAGGDEADAAGGLKALPKGGDRHFKLGRDKAGVDDGAAGKERDARGAQRDEAAAAQDLGTADMARGAAAGNATDTTAALASEASSSGAHDIAALHGNQAAHGSMHTGATTELAGATTASAPAPFEAQLSAALGSPEFAPALGVQMSILAKEGVQEARLHLNPADMGPIAVQIAVDGQHARVHFQADLAATRDALQASLPDLANAMKEAGLMLAGGDVSGGRGGSAGGAQADANANGRDAGGAGASSTVGSATATAATRFSRPRGVVDVFA